jgi:hypothetical protein
MLVASFVACIVISIPAIIILPDDLYLTHPKADMAYGIAEISLSLLVGYAYARRRQKRRVA